MTRHAPARTLLLAAIALAPAAGRAADAPDLMNYQGVLRGADDVPLSGTHDMVFRFWSASIGGNEILVDSHTAAGGAAVVVSGGLFDVQLGSGVVTDGGGPGSYTTLGTVFRDHSEVWMEITIGGEILSPRLRIASAPYASNATHVGGKRGDQVLDTSAAYQAKLGSLLVGRNDLVPTAAVAGYGSNAGGFFADLDNTSNAYVGWGGYGISAHGATTGGYFDDRDGTGYAYIGVGDRGIDAGGNYSGAVLFDRNGSGRAEIGFGDLGIDARGNEAGGYFEDKDQFGVAWVGAGARGIEAQGPNAGGRFLNTGDSSETLAAYGGYGVQGKGTTAGGYLFDANNSGYALVGYGDTGIQGYGNTAGAYFADANNSGEAFIGWGDYGIRALGDGAGGYFFDSNATGATYIASGDYGIVARGSFTGGRFAHSNDTTFWAEVAEIVGGTTYKIRGTGTVSFVQNHPYERDRLVVYAAPEGDEVAVYTRGSGRLTDGRAQVALGETFALVAHPDLGLTAHLTARDEVGGLWVESVSTSGLVVRGPAGSDARFDYLVYGLRLGFEHHSPVQVKDHEAFLPPAEAAAEFYAEHPELRRFSAFERFRAMRRERGETVELDLSKTRALTSAIDAQRDEVVQAASAAAASDRRGEPAPSIALARSGGGAAEPREPLVVAEAAAGTWVRVTAPVEAGDLLALDAVETGALRHAAIAADAGVVGVASGPSRVGIDGALEAPLHDSRYAFLKVDAGYGAIRPGDTLVASPTAGHAMRAVEPTAGVVVGRAIDGLDGGVGTIRVLLVLR